MIDDSSIREFLQYYLRQEGLNHELFSSLKIIWVVSKGKNNKEGITQYGKFHTFDKSSVIWMISRAVDCLTSLQVTGEGFGVVWPRHLQTGPRQGVILLESFRGLEVPTEWTKSLTLAKCFCESYQSYSVPGYNFWLECSSLSCPVRSRRSWCPPTSGVSSTRTSRY